MERVTKQKIIESRYFGTLHHLPKIPFQSKVIGLNYLVVHIKRDTLYIIYVPPTNSDLSTSHTYVTLTIYNIVAGFLSGAVKLDWC